MKKSKAILSISLIILIAQIFIIPRLPAVNGIIYVDDDNTEGPWDGTFEHPYQYIQDGIDAALVNGTVSVSNGTYPGDIVINKTLNVIGANKGKTIIDGHGANNVVEIIADNVSLQGFTITNGTMGITLNSSSNSTVIENTISDNDYGCYIDNLSDNNTIYHNNFIDNEQQAYDSGNNSWDDGYPSGGNYWDDYIGEDTDDDGIGEISYNIPGGDNEDRYPFVDPLTAPPNPDFMYSPLHPTTQDNIQFTDISVDPDGYITAWSWEFGDNTTSTLQNPTHRYANNGVYTVNLTVTDNYGAVAQTSQQITVLNVPPTANFTYFPSSPTDLDTVNFNDTSLDLDGQIVNWSWDFGDGNQSTEQYPTHQYSDNGTYTITLNVTDDDQATDAYSVQIQISNVPPNAQFSYSPQTPTTNDSIQFHDQSRDYDGTIVSWSWNFGDGTNSNVTSPTHNYPSEGTYTVSLTTIDNDGDSTTFSKNIIILADVTPSEQGEDSIFIYIIYLALFVIMIGIVFFLIKKYE